MDMKWFKEIIGLFIINIVVGIFIKYQFQEQPMKTILYVGLSIFDVLGLIYILIGAVCGILRLIKRCKDGDDG